MTDIVCNDVGPTLHFMAWTFQFLSGKPALDHPVPGTMHYIVNGWVDSFSIPRMEIARVNKLDVLVNSTGIDADMRKVKRQVPDRSLRQLLLVDLKAAIKVERLDRV